MVFLPPAYLPVLISFTIHVHQVICAIYLRANAPKLDSPLLYSVIDYALINVLNVRRRRDVVAVNVCDLACSPHARSSEAHPSIADNALWDVTQAPFDHSILITCTRLSSWFAFHGSYEIGLITVLH